MFSSAATALIAAESAAFCRLRWVKYQYPASVPSAVKPNSTIDVRPMMMAVAPLVAPSSAKSLSWHASLTILSGEYYVMAGLSASSIALTLNKIQQPSNIQKYLGAFLL